MNSRFLVTLGGSLFAFSSPSLGIDLNGDGVSDVYAALYPSISATSPESDFDGDGQSNLMESGALTNPEDPTDNLKCLPLVDGGAHYTIKWSSKSGLTYQVQHSNDGDVWTDIGAPRAGGAGFSSATVEKASLTQGEGDFFRVKTSGVIDSDGDGIPDWEEELLGFDPTRSASVRSAASGGDRQQLINLLTGGNALGGLAGTTAAGVPSPENASRFLAQATFGPRLQDIANLRALGSNAFEKWIDQQMGITPSYLSPYIQFLYDRRQEDYNSFLADRSRTPWQTVSNTTLLNRVSTTDISTPWMRAAVFAPDQLRQRVAFALSQILVVGRNGNNFALGSTDFYDLLIEHAFGDYEELLYQVSLHPMMGWWLSSLGNEKADPSINRLPDENYAREIMQLFSVGLFELNLDGTRKQDDQGSTIATYSIEEVQEMAKVFTGLWHEDAQWGRLPANASSQNYYANNPMAMFELRHDSGPKNLLNGNVIPAGGTGFGDIRAACRILVEHPACAPFISKQLIQFLITSNPSPAYVERIARVFVNDGTGKRGNLKAVIKAILLDSEARNPLPDLSNERVGRLREPMIRTTMLARATDAGAASPALNGAGGIQYWTPDTFTEFLQFPFSPPSVFNYFEPGYARPGEVAEKGMVSPVFQILNSYTATTSLNQWWDYSINGFHQPLQNGTGTPDFQATFTNSPIGTEDMQALIDEANLIMANGRLRSDTIDEMKVAVFPFFGNAQFFRRHTAYFLVLAAPEGAIIK